MERKQKRTSRAYKHPQKSVTWFGKFFLILAVLVLIKIGKTPGVVFSKILNLKLKIKRRGRPRTRSIPSFYGHKFQKGLYHIFPRKKRFKILLGFSILAFLIYSQLIVKISSQLPSPSRLASVDKPTTTQILDKNGKLLYQLYEGRNRELIKLDDVPKSLIEATIAIEDKHFFNHPGIDPLGIIRAARVNFKSGKLEGGSTITQQLIKNTLLTSDKTFTRKAKEAILAFWTERVYNKREILQMYFNEVPYGGPAWGAEAAARMYFGKQIQDLSLAESSFLAGLPAAPTEYSPFGSHPEKGRERQKEVLNRMVEDKYISETEAAQALSQELSFRPPTIDIKAPHFVMYVRQLLADKYGEKTVSQGGLKIITSLDLDLQTLTENILAEQIEKLAPLKVGNGAAMITDPKTGQILAMVGSKDYFDPNGGNFNAALALRPPGSSIKPITYITAFKQGYTPGNVLLDTPTIFPNPWGKNYSPVNYDGKFHGPVTIRTALGSSYNIPAVKMLNTVGIPNMIETARQMGITTFERSENYGLSLTLGGGDTKLIDMMAVYGTMAGGGIKLTPNPILSVTDSFGNVLEDHTQAVGKRVLSEQIAYLIDNVLADNKARVPAFGPNSLLEIPGHTVAVKTGTSDNKRDNWCFGFTPNYVVGVWVGNNDNSPMDPQLTSGITGAAPIWHDIMANLLKNKPDIAFNKPAGIIEIALNGHKDLGIDGKVPKTVVDYPKGKQKEESNIITSDLAKN